MALSEEKELRPLPLDHLRIRVVKEKKIGGPTEAPPGKTFYTEEVLKGNKSIQKFSPAFPPPRPDH